MLPDQCLHQARHAKSGQPLSSSALAGTSGIMTAMKCAGCGFESGQETFFHAARRSFSSKTRFLCPARFLDKNDAVLKTMFRSYPGLSLAGLVLALAL